MKLVYRWVCTPWLLSGAAKQGEIKWGGISKREREREERHGCSERARGESQGESHLFASEKLLNSMCDLRERALKSQPKMPWYRIWLLRSSELIQSAKSHAEKVLQAWHRAPGDEAILASLYMCIQNTGLLHKHTYNHSSTHFWDLPPSKKLERDASLLLWTLASCGVMMAKSF